MKPLLRGKQAEITRNDFDFASFIKQDGSVHMCLKTQKEPQ